MNKLEEADEEMDLDVADRYVDRWDMLVCVDDEDEWEGRPEPMY